MKHQPPKIDHSIPPPAEKRGGWNRGQNNSAYKRTLDAMDVGDSFWEPYNLYLRPYISRYSKETGKKFITKVESQSGKPGKDVFSKDRGIRVWRVS